MNIMKDIMDPGAGWRLLQEDEVILAGDQWRDIVSPYRDWAWTPEGSDADAGRTVVEARGRYAHRVIWRRATKTDRAEALEAAGTREREKEDGA